MNFKQFLLVCSVSVLASACTRSIETKYVPSVAAGESTASVSNVGIGVARFTDKRSWIDASDSKSLGFIAQAGQWKFGVTVDGKPFTPVDQLVRDAMGVELGRVGARVVPIEAVLGAADLSKYDAAGTAAKVDYVIGGDIAVFEFVNEQGFITVTSRRAVTLNLKVKRVGGAVIVDKGYTENDRENEGMGVLHSTNVEKLVNGALKKSIHTLITDVATALGVPANRVSVNISVESPVVAAATAPNLRQ